MALTGTDYVSLWGWFKDFTYNEAHLFVLGFYSGFVAVRPKPRQYPHKGVRAALKWDVNQWYWKGAYVLGYLLKAAIVGSIGLTGTLGGLF